MIVKFITRFGGAGRGFQLNYRSGIISFLDYANNINITAVLIVTV